MLKNILIVNSSYFPDLGGSGIITKNISEELKKQGYNITIFCGGKANKEEIINGIKIIRNDTIKELSPYTINNYYNLKIEKKFKETIKKYKIKLIHFNSIQGLGANLIEISLKEKIKTIITMHDFWWICPMLFLNDEYLSSRPAKNHHLYCTSSIAQEFLINRKNYLFNILQKKDIIITTVSSSMKNAFEYIGLPNSANYICIENGINKNQTDKKKNNNRSKKTIFGYFGGENNSKGFDLIFKSSKLLQLNTKKFKINLYGIYRPFFKNIINYKFLKKYRAKIYGIYKNENINKIMSKIDIVLIPSQVFESFSLVAREALNNNKIVISSGMGSLSEIKHKNHIIFNKNSSLDLAQKMFKTIQYKNEALKDETNNFISINQQIKSLISIYNK